MAEEDRNPMDASSYLETGESVESYVRRMLPTIEDRVDAYQKVAAAAYEREGQLASCTRWATWQPSARRTLVWAVTRFSGVIAAALIVLAMVGDTPKEGFAWNAESALVFAIILLASLTLSLGIGWYFYEEDVSLKQVMDWNRWVMNQSRGHMRSQWERDIALIRTGWVPGTVEGMERLGLSPNSSNGYRAISTTAKSTYQQYLRTPHWRRVREDALRRANYRCQLDASHTRNLQVHHNNYDCLWNEKPEDVVVLCDDCHGRFHADRRMPGN